MDTLISLAMKVLGITGTDTMKTEVAPMDNKKQTLLSQHEIVTQAAKKLLDVAEKIFEDFENGPTWEDVDRHWKAIELAEHVTRNL